MNIQETGVVASKATVDQVIKIMLKYIDRKTAIRMARDLHNQVKGNQSVVETFSRIAERLALHDEEDHQK
jgi:hypothetical protein